MGTWFEKQRGINSGRITPAIVEPTEGDKVFVLGQEDPIEPSIISIGDYTSVKQVVDLTGYDFVNATFNTLGQTAQAIPLDTALWSPDDAEIMRFEMSEPGTTCANSISGGASIADSPSVGHSVEEYSGADKICRESFAASSPGSISGINTPAMSPSASASLPKATLQFWAKIHWSQMTSFGQYEYIQIGEYFTGTGFALAIIIDGGGVKTFDGVGSMGMGPLTSIFSRTTEVGTWEMFTFVYDSDFPSTNGAWKIYINDQYIGQADIVVPGDLVLPALGELISFSGFRIPGELGPVRLLQRAMSPIEIMQSHADSTSGSTFQETKWVQQILINNVIYAEREIIGNEQRTWTDFIAPVRKLEGNQEVEFKLILLEA
jgi:hypothetical protein